MVKKVKETKPQKAEESKIEAPVETPEVKTEATEE